MRGFLLRKQFKLVRKEFEEIVTEIEGENMKISWPQGKLYTRPLFVPKGPEQYPMARKENFSEVSNIESSSHNFDSQLSREKCNKMICNCKVKCKNCSDSSQCCAESLPEPAVTSDCRTADSIAVSVSQEVNSQLSKDKSNNISKVETKNCGKLTESVAESLAELAVAPDGETSDTVKVSRITYEPVQNNSVMEKKQTVNENESRVERLIEKSPTLSHADEVYRSSTPIPSTENKQTRSWIPDSPRLFLKNSDMRQDQNMSYRGMQVLTESWMTDHSFGKNHMCICLNF